MQTTAITSSQTTPFTAGNTARTISSDFEMFLNMLTTQLRNQDPLEPADSSDYAAQLATFSGVEQQVLTNELLRGLIEQAGTGSLVQMGSWIGQEVRVAAPIWFDGAPITISPPDPQPGTGIRMLVVSEDAGAEVQRIMLPQGNGPLEWAGVTEDGMPLPPGLYRLEIETVSEGDSITREPAEIYARVEELRAGPDGPRLRLPGGVEVGVDEVTALRSGREA